jgi:hypothetical protein
MARPGSLCSRRVARIGARGCNCDSGRHSTRGQRDTSVHNQRSVHERRIRTTERASATQVEFRLGAHTATQDAGLSLKVAGARRARGTGGQFNSVHPCPPPVEAATRRPNRLRRVGGPCGTLACLCASRTAERRHEARPANPLQARRPAGDRTGSPGKHGRPS